MADNEPKMTKIYPLTRPNGIKKSYTIRICYRCHRIIKDGESYVAVLGTIYCDEECANPQKNCC